MKIYQVDAFTNEKFKGNPAAVCILYEDLNDDTLLNIAKEMNLSETAFLKKISDNKYKLRWFTPEVEISLCGHATLSSAHILWEYNYVKQNETIYFETMSGELSAKNKDGWIELDFPKSKLKISDGNSDLLNAFDKKPIKILEDGKFYFLEFEKEEDIINITPNFELLKKLDKTEIIITSISKNKNYDFISRFFAPKIGINEDPVTGSAHCYLAPYWAKRLNKTELIGFQASKRTGIVKCNVMEKRVLLKGKAVTILEGTLNI